MELLEDADEGTCIGSVKAAELAEGILCKSFNVE
jgi:hypothetical protein